MGIELDIKQHLNDIKLTASQYQQPVNEFDPNTESTEQTNVDMLLQILNVFRRRLGERAPNSQEPLAVMISLGNEQRLVIAFPGAGNQRATHRFENVNRNRGMFFNRRVRQFENEFQQFEQFRPMRRDIPRIRPFNDLPPFLRQSNRQREARLNQESQDQVSDHPVQEIIQSEMQPMQMMMEEQIDGHLRRHQRIFQNEQRVIDSTQDQIHLNQNSIRPKKKTTEEEVQQPLSCWQVITQRIANFFRRSH